MKTKRKDLDFEVGENVFLKVTLMNGVLRFGKKGKLRLGHIGPFKIFDKVGKIAY